MGELNAVETVQQQNEAAERQKARRRRWGWALSLSLPLLTAGAAAYLFFTPVDPNQGVRCYYEADLSAIRPLDSGAALPPYVVVGDRETGASDALRLCADVWKEGTMGPNPAIPVPELTACVVDEAIAVIPGRPDVCAGLGLEKLD
ncbi:hypothetical protein V1639_09260 [Pseudarthrobacter sp. J75]|uniref:hypothetical protein n=1 Tax=unclassified Pseudarthrobacter TaxID=2647000 RepID=UPI002E7FFBC8|nr:MULTISPECIES: hypothetical protein [unclassified Pseudarthrobacter]MEE2522455.1 hypothetical protein [Pseudarthrobacter sp. J47]MEE2529214.1 hypothetical protein [Pseudarthrobacter sp. J75]